MKRTELKRSTKRIPAKRGTSTAALKRKADAAWGQWIHTRDKHCQYCGKTDGKLDAHHIMIRNFNATRTDEDNGVLLDYQHHQLMHSDPIEAVRFYTRILGVEGYEALRRKAYDGVGGKYPASYWKNELARLVGLLEEVNQT